VLKSTNPMTTTDMGKVPLAIVPEGGVSNIVTKGNGLDEVFIQPEKAANIPSYLGKKLDVQNPVSNVVIVNQVENLGLVNVAGVGQRMEYSVPIQGEMLPVPSFNLFFWSSPDGCCAKGSVWGKHTCFPFGKFLFSPQQG
jgi:hypothetical protein